MAINIAISGFGRIGRLILRAVYEQNYQGIKVVACVLKARNFVADREPHRGLSGCDTKLFEQLNEIWIVSVVVDDKAGIHRKTSGADLSIVGSCMAPDPVPSFKHFDAMTPLDEPVGAPEPRDTRPYNCNIHCRRTSGHQTN